MTQDIGAADLRFKKYKFDRMIYVTDFRQSLHFKQLFEMNQFLASTFSSSSALSIWNSKFWKRDNGHKKRK